MADRPKVFVARIIPEEGLEAVRASCDVDLWEDELPPPRDELLRRVAGCDGVLTLLTDRVDDEFLDAAGPQLKVVSNYAVGFDNIDVAACARRGIPVGNTPGVLTDTTADLAWALLMAAARRLPEGDRYVRDGRWKTWGPLLLLGPDVHGATIGIVGFGRIGQAVARRAQGFGMEILYHDVHQLPDEVTAPLGATYLPLEALLARSDFVSLHVNLSPVTRAPDQRRDAGLDEADGRARQHVPGPGRGPGRARGCAPGRHDLGRRAGRDRSRADPDGRSAGRARQLPDRAAHRVRVTGDARQDGCDGCREPGGGRARRATADAGSAAGLTGSAPRRRYDRTMYPSALRPLYEGWSSHQALVIDALRDLTPEQLDLRTAPHQWAVWQLAAHVAGSRAYWFHDVLGEGDASTRDLFRVQRTTVPGLAIDDAGWEDVEDDPRNAAQLVDGLARTWTMVDACLRRWSPEDLDGTIEQPPSNARPARTHHRGWVVWHVLEHDLHHGGEISQILGSHGLPGLDL